MNRVGLALGLVLAAGQASGQVFNWAAAVDGNWNDSANWAPTGVPDSPGESAVLGLAGPYLVAANINVSIDALTLTNTQAAVEVQPSRVLGVGAAGVINDGVIFVNNGSSSNTALDLLAGGLIAGTGQIVLVRATADAFDAQVRESGGLGIVHAATHTISGSGIVNGIVANDGLVVADDPAFPLDVRGTITQSLTGVLRGDGSTLGMQSVTISGGLLEGINGGVVATTGNNAILSDLTLQGEGAVSASHALTIAAPGITNSGTLTVNPTGSSSNTVLTMEPGALLDGAGEVVLVRSTPDANDAQLTTSGASATIGASQTVRGSGLVSGDFLNDGLILADDAAQALQITGIVDQGAGGTISADGATALFSNATVIGGHLDSTNLGLVDVAANRSVSLDGVTNAGSAAVRGSGVLGVAAGGLTNNGDITVNTFGDTGNAVMLFEVDALIDGVGEIRLNQTSGDVNDAQLNTAPDAIGALGPGQTVNGRGELNGDFVSAGIIHADLPGLEIRVSGSVAQDGGGVMLGDAGVVALGNVTVTGGSFNGLNGGLVDVLSSTTATVSGVTSLGSAGVRGSGTMAIGAGGLTNEGTLVINTLGDTGNAQMRFDADAAIDGAGRIKLNQVGGDQFDAQLNTSDGVTGTNGADHTIAGRGRIDADLVNDGTIVADVPGFDLRAIGNFDQTGGGVMRGDGGFLALDNGSVTGGALDGVNGGRVEVVAGGVTLVTGVTMTGENGVRGSGLMALTGDVTNDGVFIVNTLGDTGNARLTAEADVTINGSGETRLNQVGGDPFDARIDAGVFTLTLGDSQTLTGRGRIDGALVCNGGVSPGIGGAAALQAFDTLTLGGTGTCAFEVGETEFDQISGSADVSIDGALEVSYLDGYSPSFADEFSIISGSSISGQFSSVTGPDLPGEWLWRVRYDPTEAVLIITCAADSNLDGTVNTLDFIEFLNLWVAGDPEADYNEDGTVNTLDFIAYLNDWVAGCS